MQFLSQNKKIILSSISVAVVSIAILLVFVTTNKEGLQGGHANVSGASSSHTVEVAENAGYSSYLQENENNWFVTDTAGKYIEVSDEFCEMTGKKAEEINGTLLFQYINVKDLPAIISENSKLLLEANSVEGLGPYRFLKDTDKELLLIFKAVPILDNENLKVSKILFSVKDITGIVDELKRESAETEL